jgi:hypothetical protein
MTCVYRELHHQKCTGFSSAGLDFTAWSHALQKLPNGDRSNPTNDTTEITRDLRIEDPAPEEAGDKTCQQHGRKRD